MFTLILVYRALWGGESGRTPRLILAGWIALSLCMPFQLAVPAAMAGEPLDGLEMSGDMDEAALMTPMREAVIERMPQFSVVAADAGAVLGALSPENALVLTSMDDFRRRVRLAGQ